MLLAIKLWKQNRTIWLKCWIAQPLGLKDYIMRRWLFFICRKKKSVCAFCTWVHTQRLERQLTFEKYEREGRQGLCHVTRLLTSIFIQINLAPFFKNWMTESDQGSLTPLYSQQHRKPLQRSFPWRWFSPMDVST